MALSRVGLVTVGTGQTEDRKILFDGNAQDFHIGIDDSADDLVIGKGSALGTTANIVIDENGHVTKPLQPCFLGRIGSDQSISATSATTLTIDTERFDQNADFNTGTYTFTAPVTGRYMFSAFASYNALTAGTYVSLFIETSNATYHAVGDVSGNSFNSQSITIVADMDTNDTALLKNETQGDSSYTARGGTATFFSGCLLA